MTTAIDLLRNPRLVADDLDHCFGSGQDACLQWDTAEANDALKLGLKLNDAAFSGNFILVNKDHIDKNTGLGASVDPRLAVWSGDDPAAGGANEYVSLRHNRTDAVIESGAGDIRLEAASKVMIGGSSAPSADSPLHIWASTAGAVAALSGSVVTLESGDTDKYLSFLQLNTSSKRAGIVVGHTNQNGDGQFTYKPSIASWETYINGNVRLKHTISAFAFQQATDLTTPASADLGLLPGSGGSVKFGTHAAIGAEAVTGYITIKDSGGTSRKLAVVS